MGKKKKSDRVLTALIPWRTRSDGSRYIELEPGIYITPETELNVYAKSTNKLVDGEMAEVSLTKDGLVFHTKSNRFILPNGKSNFSIGYTVEPSDDSSE